jgi:uncharacterized membrane protein YfcA
VEYVLIPAVGFVVSALTFFSGFGLGTLLLPAFVVFFPAEVAVGLTAVVHALNNAFKFLIVRGAIDTGVVLRFGVPAMLASYLGATLLASLAHTQTAVQYRIFSLAFTTSRMNLVMALLIIFFATFEIMPGLRHLSVSRKYLPVGGLLSGFFGGLSGHQGAFRGIFLLRSGLSNYSYIATSIAIALLVDIIRLGVYGMTLSHNALRENLALLLTVLAAAFAGAYLGNRLAGATTFRAIQVIISVLLFVIAGGLLTGWLG